MDRLKHPAGSPPLSAMYPPPESRPSRQSAMRLLSRLFVQMLFRDAKRCSGLKSQLLPLFVAKREIYRLKGRAPNDATILSMLEIWRLMVKSTSVPVS